MSCLVLFQAAVVSEGVARWEDNKKWQQKVETLKAKLAEKTRELEKAQKTIAMLREALNRAEKDKAGLHSRLKRCEMFIVLTLSPCSWLNLVRLICVFCFSSVKAGAVEPSVVTNEVVQDLKHSIFKLQEEVLCLLQLDMAMN